MTELQVQAALTQVILLERDARAHWQASATPAAEQQAALDVVRQTTAVIRSLERFVAARRPAAVTT